MSEASNYPRTPQAVGVKRTDVRVPRRLCKEVGAADPQDIANLFEDSAKMFASGASVEDVATSSEQAGWSKDMSMWSATMAHRFGKDVELKPERPEWLKFMRVFLPFTAPVLTDIVLMNSLAWHLPKVLWLLSFRLQTSQGQSVYLFAMLAGFALGVSNWANEKGLSNRWAATALLGPVSLLAVVAIAMAPSRFDYQLEAA